MLERFAVLSSLVYAVVELFKVLYDRVNHKFNLDVIVALGVGVAIAFGGPYNLFLALGVRFEDPIIAKILTGVLLGGVGGKFIHWIDKKAAT